MTPDELAELLRRGEDSTLEFKRDDVQNHDLESGIRAICYTGANRDYATRADEDIRGPMVFLGSANGELTETGLVERALDFVRRNTETTALLDRGRRIDRREYPEAVIRELVVNALVHRDYSIAGADILLEIFSDRLEVTSPGKLPNTVWRSKTTDCSVMQSWSICRGSPLWWGQRLGKINAVRYFQLSQGSAESSTTISRRS